MSQIKFLKLVAVLYSNGYFGNRLAIRQSGVIKFVSFADWSYFLIFEYRESKKFFAEKQVHE